MRRVLLDAASTVQYDAAREPGRQLNISLRPEPFTRRRQRQPRAARREIPHARLGAVAVVHVEVEHGHFLGAVRPGVKGGDGDAIEKTKSHGALASGVMAGWAEQGKVGFAGLSEFQRAQGAANGTACVGINIRIIGSIAVKRPLGLGDQPHVSFFVGAGDQGVGHFGGLVPGDLQLGLLA